MKKVVDETLARLRLYFAMDNFNRMLKFDSTQTTGIGHVAQLKSGNELLFFIGFPNRDLLELFMLHIGEECSELGECLFLAGTPQDRDLIQRYWILSIEAGSFSDDSRLPELA